MENNKPTVKTIEIMGEEVRESDIHDLLKEAMRELGHKTYVDVDGIEKPL